MDLLESKQQQQQKQQPGGNKACDENSDPGNEEPVLCEHHGKPCALFCLEIDCWDLLCPRCPLRAHEGHDMVTLAECACVNDCEALEEMKLQISCDLAQLHTYELNVRGSKFLASRESDEAVKSITRKANELKSIIDRKACELKRDVQQLSKEEVRKLDTVLQSLLLKAYTGQTLKRDIETRPRGLGGPRAIKHVAGLKQRLAKFREESSEEQSKTVDYDVIRFKPTESEAPGVGNPLGELVTTRNVIGCLDSPVPVVEVTPPTPALAAAMMSPDTPATPALAAAMMSPDTPATPALAAAMMSPDTPATPALAAAMMSPDTPGGFTFSPFMISTASREYDMLATDESDFEDSYNDLVGFIVES